MSAAELANVVAGLILPPGGLILLTLAGVALTPLRPRWGMSLAFAATLGLYAIATPFVATRLLHALESPYVDPAHDATGEAIVVLGGGLRPRAPEYGSDTVSRRSLERVRYAAWLQDRLAKPILLAGGNPGRAGSTEAEQMNTVLGEFGTTARWLESASDNTVENARYTRRALRQTGVSRIYHVTHASHMPRARRAFEEAGFTVIPAAIGFVAPLEAKASYLVPNAEAVESSGIFFREIGGLAWYRLKSIFARDTQAAGEKP